MEYVVYKEFLGGGGEVCVISIVIICTDAICDIHSIADWCTVLPKLSISLTAKSAERLPIRQSCSAPLTCKWFKSDVSLQLRISCNSYHCEELPRFT